MRRSTRKRCGADAWRGFSELVIVLVKLVSLSIESHLFRCKTLMLGVICPFVAVFAIHKRKPPQMASSCPEWRHGWRQKTERGGATARRVVAPIR